MVLCLTEAAADRVNLRLSVRLARKRPEGAGELRPLKSDAQQAGTPVAAALSRLLPPKAAAQFFSVKEGDLARWRQNGLGPLYLSYPNGAVRYSLESLAAWLEDGLYEGGESWERHSAAGAVSNARVQ